MCFNSPVIKFLIEAFLRECHVNVGQCELQHVVRIADRFILKLCHFHRVSGHHQLESKFRIKQTHKLIILCGTIFLNYPLHINK